MKWLPSWLQHNECIEQIQLLRLTIASVAGILFNMTVSNRYTHSELMSARQVAEAFPDSGLSRAMLWRWAREGHLAAVRLPSGRVRFRREDIEALLTPQIAPSPSASSADDSDSAVELPGQEVMSW